MVAPALIVAIISTMIGGASLITTAIRNAQGLDADQCYVVFKHTTSSRGVDLNFRGADGSDNFNKERFTGEYDGTFERIAKGSPLDWLSVQSWGPGCIRQIFLHCGTTAGGGDRAMVDVNWNHFAAKLVSGKVDPGSYVCGEEDKKGIRIGGPNGLSKVVIKYTALACPPENSECIIKGIEAHTA